MLVAGFVPATRVSAGATSPVAEPSTDSAIATPGATAAPAAPTQAPQPTAAAKPAAKAPIKATVLVGTNVPVASLAPQTSLPIALGYGAGGEARQPLGLAVIGGLLFSQLITLYLTPVVYTDMASLSARGAKPVPEVEVQEAIQL